MPLAANRALPVDRIPLIDFAPFLAGREPEKHRVAGSIAEACETIGFLYLANHGVPAAKIAAVFAAAREFFHLPLEFRLSERLRCTPEENRGYMPLGSRHYAGTGAPDLMEAFKVQIELPPDDPDIRAGDRLHYPNRWPDGMPEWRATVLDYFDEMTRLSQRLLRAFALALELEEDYFLAFYRKPLTQLSLIHYPPQEPAAPDDEYGIRPHADATSFTILAQDEVGGLEVLSPAGGWIQARPIPGTFVINIGDMMARWTNDRFASTKHRVFNRAGRERYSLPFFGIPDFDAVVSCLPSCQGPDNPPKYPPLHVGESIRKKNAADWSKRGRGG
ncbi:MAG TPA: 2-oxoglutarate and iron-dependent oxygenase domain-containing protein [Alphaproteobacteria bacterium]|nr:2-oxoglutarate and iron-dependent oxygenase domain-containing protein [Alphaproteobacteria bacterium]